jgi:hypothetical protein
MATFLPVLSSFLLILHFYLKRTPHGRIEETEVLYVLLTFSEPQTGFRIAFNMFDTDGNQRVDKNEFLVVSINPGMLQPN